MKLPKEEEKDKFEREIRERFPGLSDKQIDILYSFPAQNLQAPILERIRPFIAQSDELIDDSLRFTAQHICVDCDGNLIYQGCGLCLVKSSLTTQKLYYFDKAGKLVEKNLADDEMYKIKNNFGGRVYSADIYVEFQKEVGEVLPGGIKPFMSYNYAVKIDAKGEPSFIDVDYAYYEDGTFFSSNTLKSKIAQSKYTDEKGMLEIVNNGIRKISEIYPESMETYEENPKGVNQCFKNAATAEGALIKDKKGETESLKEEIQTFVDGQDNGGKRDLDRKNTNLIKTLPDRKDLPDRKKIEQEFKELVSRIRSVGYDRTSTRYVKEMDKKRLEQLSLIFKKFNDEERSRIADKYAERFINKLKVSVKRKHEKTNVEKRKKRDANVEKFTEILKGRVQARKVEVGKKQTQDSLSGNSSEGSSELDAELSRRRIKRVARAGK